ncbi:hypothetical protein [Clostridium tetani]|uniref:hypothetical protein n=1 Tax=Clostridium tetani TaxID=1513 RepID=UPI001009C9ED|nr:hypothetical protein [Clostridium tetani]RXI69219.1 hypothetical protein DQN76_08005 [Clostridium tetani]
MKNKYGEERCKCGGYICPYINFNDMGECCDCNKPYIFKDEKWEKISKSEFRVKFREKLIEQQKSNLKLEGDNK